MLSFQREKQSDVQRGFIYLHRPLFISVIYLLTYIFEHLSFKFMTNYRLQ